MQEDTMRNRRKLSGWLPDAVMILAALICVLPILYILSISLSDERALAQHGYRLIPYQMSGYAYAYVLNNSRQLLTSYGVTILVTAAGTLGSLTVSSMLAYAMTRRDFMLHKAINFAVFFTMIFNVGLVPWYILIVRYYHLKDTILSLILPYMIVPWNVFLIKSFLMDFPVPLIEAARIDGSSEERTFFQIVLPNCKPALATVGLFIAFAYWNDWWLSMLFIEDNRLIPLQLMLYRIMSSIEFLSTSMNTGAISADVSKFPSESARMAMCVLAAGPMLVVFPFFQKYFVKGLTVGAVKG